MPPSPGAFIPLPPPGPPPALPPPTMPPPSPSSIGSAPRMQPPSPSSAIAQFQACRLSASANGTRFLEWGILTRELHQVFGHRTPHEVSHAINALQRMLLEVNSAIDAVIATHHVLTLHELEERVLRSSHSFEGVERFDDLRLGPLRAHPTVRSVFQAASLGTGSSEGLATISSIEVMSYIAGKLEANWDGAQETRGEKLDVKASLDAFAAERGFASAGQLGLHVRSGNFVTGLVARCLVARRRAEQQAERVRQSARQYELTLQEQARQRGWHEQLRREELEAKEAAELAGDERRKERVAAAVAASVALEHAQLEAAAEAAEEQRRAGSAVLEEYLRGAMRPAGGELSAAAEDELTADALWQLATAASPTEAVAVTTSAAPALTASAAPAAAVLSIPRTAVSAGAGLDWRRKHGLGWTCPAVSAGAGPGEGAAASIGTDTGTGNHAGVLEGLLPAFTERSAGQLHVSADGRYVNNHTHEWMGARADVGVQLSVAKKALFDTATAEGFALYFEVSVVPGAPSSDSVCRVGWSRAGASLSALGKDWNSFGYGGTGWKSHGNQFSQFGERYGAGDTIGCLLQHEAGRLMLWYFKNGQLQLDMPLDAAQPASSFFLPTAFDAEIHDLPRGLYSPLALSLPPSQPLSGSWHPAICLKNCAVRVNFGEHSFVTTRLPPGVVSFAQITKLSRGLATGPIDPAALNAARAVVQNPSAAPIPAPGAAPIPAPGAAPIPAPRAAPAPAPTAVAPSHGGEGIDWAIDATPGPTSEAVIEGSLLPPAPASKKKKKAQALQPTCFFCNKTFKTLSGLRSHIGSKKNDANHKKLVGLSDYQLLLAGQSGELPSGGSGTIAQQHAAVRPTMMTASVPVLGPGSEAASAAAGGAVQAADGLRNLLTIALPPLIRRALKAAPAPGTEPGVEPQAGFLAAPQGDAALASTIVDHIRSLLSEALESDEGGGDSSLLTLLASTERKLLTQRRIQRFEQLGLAEGSFNAFCAAHAAHLDALIPSPQHGGHSGSRRVAALHVASALLCAHPNASDGSLQGSLAAHFGVSDVSELGWSSLSEMRRCALATEPPASVPPRACVLALSDNGQDSSTAGAMLGTLDAEAAERAISSTPLLVDIGAHTHWAFTFGPQLGQLAAFLGEASRTERLNLLEVGCDQFVRLEAGSLASFRAACERLQPVRAAAIAVHHCLGGIAQAPLALLCAYAQRGLAAAPSAVILFCLRALAALPPLLLPTLGRTVFLEAAKVEPNAMRRLLEAASAPRERQALHRIGYTAGIAEFLTDYLAAREFDEPPVISPLAQQAALHHAQQHRPSYPSPPQPSPRPEPGTASEAISRNSSGSAPAALEADAMDATDVVDAADVAPVAATSSAFASSDCTEPCVEICERIGARFGHGLEVQLDGQGRGALERLRAVTMRSIQRLAAELYGGNGEPHPRNMKRAC